jgi:hypothetical protein
MKFIWMSVSFLNLNNQVDWNDVVYNHLIGPCCSATTKTLP